MTDSPAHDPIPAGLWIVIPTYNERTTVPAVLKRLLPLASAQIVIVDDNSPDGTSDLVAELQANQPRLNLLRRPMKAGLASAYRDGCRYALDHGARYIVQMDADGSHDPDRIPEMINRLTAADLVIASRYVPGGRLMIPWHRRWISVGGNWYMRLLLGREIHDWSAGFKAWRSQLLQQVLAQPLQAVGYAGQIEMVWYARRVGGRVAEVPLQFTERQAGQSKFSVGIMIEDVLLAIRLWRRRHEPLAFGEKKL